MEYFKKYFNEVENWENEEVKVLCPFHEDTHPSASINTYKDLFHCWVCDIGYNEEQFIARINGISSADAIKLLNPASKLNKHVQFETKSYFLNEYINNNVDNNNITTNAINLEKEFEKLEVV